EDFRAGGSASIPPWRAGTDSGADHVPACAAAASPARLSFLSERQGHPAEQPNGREAHFRSTGWGLAGTSTVRAYAQSPRKILLGRLLLLGGQRDSNPDACAAGMG